MKEDVEEAGLHYLDEAYAEATLGSTQGLGSEEQKILGVRWEPDGDQLVLDVANVAQLASILEPTKRNIVSTIGRFYDPLGFLAPLIIKFKVVFHKLCESKVDWDQKLAGELVHKWTILVSDLKESQLISIPRSYFTGIDGEITSAASAMPPPELMLLWFTQSFQPHKNLMRVTCASIENTVHLLPSCPLSVSYFHFLEDAPLPLTSSLLSPQSTKS